MKRFYYIYTAYANNEMPPKASHHYARVSRKSRISPFKAVDMKIFLTGSSIHLPCYPLTGAYRHKHPLTLTHTQRTVTKSPFLHMHAFWGEGGASADSPCGHGENKHTPERNQRVTYSNSLAEQGQNAAFVFTVGKPRNLQKV